MDNNEDRFNADKIKADRLKADKFKADRLKADTIPKPPSIFDIEVGSEPVQGAILSSILKMLEVDPAWMSVRSKIIKRYPANPENLPYPGPEKNYLEGAVIVGSRQTNLETVADIFNSYARALGVATEFTTDLDCVSAAVALELWASVFYLDRWQGALKCAGIEGPDALNSLGAILARAFGQSVPCMPFDPDLPNVNFESKIFFNTVKLCREFVERTIGNASWHQVINNVVSDLGYRAQGDSRTHNASLILKLVYTSI